MTKRLFLCASVLAILSMIIAGCASDGVSTYTSVHYGYGYYDTWYRHDVIVRPPPQRPPAHRPRPEQPIYRPPPPRPTPLPSRPMPRPARR